MDRDYDVDPNEKLQPVSRVEVFVTPPEDNVIYVLKEDRTVSVGQDRP